MFGEIVMHTVHIFGQSLDVVNIINGNNYLDSIDIQYRNIERNEKERLPRIVFESKRGFI